MKFLFIVVLIANVIYLGYEIDRETRMHKLAIPPIPKQIANEQLQLLSSEQRDFLKRRQQPDETIELPDADITAATQEQTIMDLNTPSVAIEASDSDARLLDMLQMELPQPVVANEQPESAIACFAFGPFDQHASASELIDWFTQQSYTYQERWQFENKEQLFWVYLAPVAERSAALATLEQLEQQGVEDFRLIRKGSFKNAISLGLFSSQARVNRRLSELNSKGYRPIAVPYDSDDDSKVMWLDVVFPNQTDALNPLYRGLPARFNSLPRDCNEIDMAAAKP